MRIPGSISFYIISLGCSKNLVDSEFLQGTLESAGFEPAGEADEADLVIINTCGFIQDAKKESIDVIFDAIGLREAGGAGPNGNGPFVVVAGCLSQRYMEALSSEIPEIDFIYGLVDENFLPGMAKTLGIQVEHALPGEKVPLVKNIPYRYIKIAEGCSNNCSYCAIPLIRGPHVSRSPGQVLHDSRLALDAGALELNIIAQDITSYRYGSNGLKELVDEISILSERQFWIRLLYCHPDHVDDSTISLLAENEKVVPYIDIPMQHVSGDILRSMGRTGGSAAYEKLVAGLRRNVPGIRIRSTFMVGYPGETDKDFEELMQFIKTVQIDRVGCFMYSPEEGTAAAGLKDSVPGKKKKQRFDGLMNAQKKISLQKNREMTGKQVTVLVEEQVDRSNWLGRTQYDAPEVDGIFFLTGDNVTVHSFVEAIVTDALEYDLTGEPV